MCLGTFMLLLDITIVNVALPDVQRALHSSFADLQWVVDAYALTLASFLLIGGQPRAPRPAIRKAPGNEATRTGRHAARIGPGRHPDPGAINAQTGQRC